jgi:Mg/Co/Ni transporter MgtE
VKETFAQLEEQIEEDVDALLEGEDLSEEFRDKAKLIFETAINSKISEIYESLEQRYEEELLEEVNTIKGQIVERVDAYLEYVADEWLQENALVVEQGLKTEMTESFLQGMKSLFEDHYVSIPEEKYDVVESMVDKLDEMEGKLNEQIERNVALNRRLSESVADVIFSQISEGLATSQKDKLASLSENVEFESETNYRDKLVTLRESYFPKYASNQRDHSEILSEEMNYDEPVSGIMESYLQTLSRVSRK